MFVLFERGRGLVIYPTAAGGTSHSRFTEDVAIKGKRGDEREREREIIKDGDVVEKLKGRGRGIYYIYWQDNDFQPS